MLRAVIEGGESGWPVAIRTPALAVLVLVALAPLVSVAGMMYPSVVPKAVLVRSAVGIGTALLVWGIATSRTEPLDLRDPVLWSLSALAGVSVLSALAGPGPQHSFFGDLERTWGAVQWVYLTLLYVLLRAFVGDREWPFFLRVALYVAIGVAAFGIFEFAVERAVSGAPRTGIASTLGIEGYLGGYMVLAAGLALVVADRARSGAEAVIPAGVAVLFGAVLMLSGIRAALLGAVLGAGVGLCLFTLRGADRRRTVAIGFGAVSVVASLALWGAWALAPEVLLEVPVVGRIVQIDPTTGSLAGRFGAWEAGVEGFAARPLTGWGPENFDLLYARFVDPVMHRLNPEGMRFDRAHNVLVGRLAETGPAGLLAYLAVWGSLFATGVRAWREEHLGPLEGAALLAALFGYFVYLQFWFEDHSTAVLLITLAAYLRHRRSGSSLFRVQRQEGRSAARSAVWGTACLGIAGVAVWLSARSALAAARMVDAHAAEDLGTKVERFEQARRAGAPEHRSIALEYASSMADLGLQSGQRLRSSETLRPLYSRGVEGADRALAAAADSRPLDAWIDAHRGRLAAGAARVFAGDGIQSMARESLGRAVEKSPALLEHRHTLASIQALLGSPDSARRTLREALELYDGYGRTYYLLSRMSPSVGDSAALSRLRQAFWLDYYPQERGYLRRTLEALLGRGEPGKAERLLSEYVASRYLPDLRERGDPFGAERRKFLDGLTAAVEPAGREGRPRAIAGRDTPLLATWIRAAVAAGRCRRAAQASRILLNGLSEGQRTASLRPVLARQLVRLRERCRAAPRT